MSKNEPFERVGEQFPMVSRPPSDGPQDGMTNKVAQKMYELEEQYPWLKELEALAHELVSSLYAKEASYQGSWQKRGGVGAFMMLARKWDRLEGFAENAGYDIFKALAEMEGDPVDDLDDLICYLLLVRSEDRRRQAQLENADED